MALCEHLAQLEFDLQTSSFAETYRGRPWSRNCREWVYFDCVLDRAALRRRLRLADCVTDHQHLGTHDGAEAGFVCTIHDDAVIGLHPEAARDAPVHR